MVVYVKLRGRCEVNAEELTVGRSRRRSPALFSAGNNINTYQLYGNLFEGRRGAVEIKTVLPVTVATRKRNKK
jgi:hypothetical protein